MKGSVHRFDKMTRKDLSTRFLDREKTKRGNSPEQKEKFSLSPCFY